MDNFLVHEVAEQTGLHPNTIRNLAKKGLISCRRNYIGYRTLCIQFTEECQSDLAVHIRFYLFPSSFHAAGYVRGTVQNRDLFFDQVKNYFSAQ